MSARSVKRSKYRKHEDLFSGDLQAHIFRPKG
jgi:hypothetical protein